MAVSSIPARSVLALGAAFALVGPAAADIQVSWAIDGVEVFNQTFSGGEIMGTLESYQGSTADSGSVFDWALTGDSDAFNANTSAAFVGGGLNVTNLDDVSHRYTITVLMDLANPLGGSLVDATVDGSFRGGPNSGTYDFSTDALDGYNFLGDGNSLYSAWQGLNSTSSGSNDPQDLPSADMFGDGAVFPPGAGGPALSQIGFSFDFELSGGGAGTSLATQVAAAIPAPAALAPLAMLGLFGRRRRRD